jgi:hypothetical protein
MVPGGLPSRAFRTAGCCLFGSKQPDKIGHAGRILAPADGSAFAGLNQRRTRLIRSNIFPANTVQNRRLPNDIRSRAGEK